MVNKLAPVVLFVYNRLDHTKKTIEALKKNTLAKESELIIFSDAAKDENSLQRVNDVRQFLQKVDGFKNITIHQRDTNLGLARSVITGVSQVINKYGKVIVLEDDLETAPSFLFFMNSALDFYEKNEKVFSVTGYNIPKKQAKLENHYNGDTYFHIRPMSWSWGTWESRWKNIKWDMDDFYNFIFDYKKRNSFNKGGKDLSLMLLNQHAGLIDSWYIRWAYNAYKLQKYTVYPVHSLVNNLGFDDSGVHGKKNTAIKYAHTSLSTLDTWKFNNEVVLNPKFIYNLNAVFNPPIRTQISLNIRLFFKLDKRLRVKK